MCVMGVNKIFLCCQNEGLKKTKCKGKKLRKRQELSSTSVWMEFMLMLISSIPQTKISSS